MSALVSRGEWRGWTLAALSYLPGPRVLELAFGTGNLHLSLWEAGIEPVGLDLSPYMVEITRYKFVQARRLCRLVRGRMAALPFPAGTFDQVVVTFPPGGLGPEVLSEIRRVLDPAGALVWVDGGRLNSTDAWSRFLNAALDLTSGRARRERGEGLGEDQAGSPGAVLPEGTFQWLVERVVRPRSTVYVIRGTPLPEN